MSIASNLQVIDLNNGERGAKAPCSPFPFMGSLASLKKPTGLFRKGLRFFYQRFSPHLFGVL